MNDVLAEKLTSFRITFQRYFILLKGSMVRIRSFYLPIPGAEGYPIMYSFSSLAGHGSFIFIALSYLENDFMLLRMYATSGIFLAILYQYYREKPLWMPMKWNTLFLSINIFMLYFLLRDSQEARNIPNEAKTIYVQVFEKLGLPAIDFLHLMQKAERYEFKKGDYLIKQGVLNNHIYIVVKGSLRVMRDNKYDQYHLGKHQFVGEMSFFSWKEELENVSQGTSDSKGNAEKSSMSLPILPATLSTTSSQNLESDHLLGMPGTASVVCLEPCIVYGWKFQDLYAMLMKEPKLGPVFERCLSTDLFHKMKEKWSEEPLSRYKVAMKTAISSGQVRALVVNISTGFSSACLEPVFEY